MVQFFFHTNLHDVVYTVIQKPLVGLGSGIVPTLIALFLSKYYGFSACMVKSLSTR